MTHRKTPETVGPKTPSHWCSVESSSFTGPAMALIPSASSRHIVNTTLEWPRENQKPTDTGLFSRRSVSSLRVVLSMAAMWSASKA